MSSESRVSAPMISSYPRIESISGRVIFSCPTQTRRGIRKVEVSCTRSQEKAVWSRGLTHLGQVCGMGGA